MHLSFPFRFDTIHGGLTDVSGICHCTDTGIVCEFRLDIGGLGLKTGVKEACLDFQEIAECRFWKSWFSSGVKVFTTSMKVLERFPAHGEDHLVLRVRRRDRKRAALVASEIELRAIEARRRSGMP